MANEAAPQFPSDAFARIDIAPDSEFYAQPRLVYHIDEYAVRAVGEVYRRFLKPGGEYLDLMSSWVSHLPEDFEVAWLIGHGMNEEELQANPRLHQYFVQDLNVDPTLPFDDNSFDGVLICVSVQYLTKPLAVFDEIGRVLRPGAPLIVTYSDRCFPTKAVKLWQTLGDQERGGLVALYAQQCGRFGPAKVYNVSPRLTMLGVPDNERLRERIRNGSLPSDPLYAVVIPKQTDATG